MNEVTTITFQDASEQCEATAIVRASADHISVALTLATYGDTEVVMTHEVAKELFTALGAALSNRDE